MNESAQPESPPLRHWPRRCSLSVSLSVGLALAGLVTGLAAENPAVRVTCQLEDGSRLVATLAQDVFVIEADALGTLKIPVARVGQITTDASNSNSVIRLVNGDLLRGHLRQPAFELTAAFGAVRLNANLLREMQLHPGGGVGLDADCVLYYSFDADGADVVRDESGQGHAGRNQGGRWVAQGVRGGAMKFDGNGSQITFDDHGLPAGNAARSVVFWLKSSQNQKRQALFFYGQAVSLRGIYYAIFEQGRAEASRLTVGDAGGTEWERAGRRVVADGRWHHVALVYNGDGQVRSYVDGPLDLEYARRYDTVCSGSGFIANSAWNDSFEGYLDEFKIFRRALSADEVAAMARAGDALPTLGLPRAARGRPGTTSQFPTDSLSRPHAAKRRGVRMTRHFVIGCVLLTALLAFTAGCATPAKPVQWTVELRDGSRIMGRPRGNKLDVQTLYGKVQLKLACVTTLERQPDPSKVSIHLQNGDQLLGELTACRLELKTVFGHVVLPLAQVKRLTLVGSGEDHSLGFDGAQNFVSIPYSADFYRVPLTIEFWFKWTGPVKEGSGVLGIFDGHARGWAVQTKWNDKVRFVAFGLTGGAFWGGLFDSSIGVCDGAWHHIAIVYTGARVAEFVDGHSAGRWSVAGEIVPATLPLDVGGWPHVEPVYIQHDYDWFAPARVCELRISNAARYQAEFTPPLRLTADSQTLGYWKFGEGTGPTARDRSGHGHDGELVGDPAPAWQLDRPTP